MSNYIDSIPSFKNYHDSIQGFITGIKNHWNSFSGFNTLITYTDFSKKDIFRKSTQAKGSLLESLDILIDYIDEILTLKPDNGNHDINLNTQLEIMKTEMHPLLPDSCQSFSYEQRGRLFYIYRMVIRIHSGFLLLQDLLQINDALLRFHSIIESEKTVIEFIRNHFYNLCYTRSSVSVLKEIRTEVFHSFSKLLLDLRYSESGTPHSNDVYKILRILTKMNECNEGIQSGLKPDFKLTTNI